MGQVPGSPLRVSIPEVILIKVIAGELATEGIALFVAG